MKTNQASQDMLSYFHTKAHAYIFYLLELDGAERVKKLGITPGLFVKKEAATGWRRSIAMEIHPDHCSHPNATLAMGKLNELYEQMID